MTHIGLIAKEGEGQFSEFKRSMCDISPEMTAFANSAGGRIYLGIDDNGSVPGITISNRLKSQIVDMARNCDPAVKVAFRVHEDKGRHILEVEVPEGMDKPYQCRGGFYLRQGATTQKLRRSEIVSLIWTSHGRMFDSIPNAEFVFKRDFDREKLSRYLVLAGLDVKVSTENLLKSLDVLKDGRMTNAGVLFFSKNPQHFFMNSAFTCALFRDTDRTDVIDRKEITGGLFEVVQGVMKFVEMSTKVAYRFTGKPRRENVYEYPLKAVREAVINAVMHKFYPQPGHNNMLFVYPDRIEIEDYWIRPANYIVGQTVHRQNALISDLFNRLEMGERLGTGIKRIRDECRKVHAPLPRFKIEPNYFYITFRPSRDYMEMAGTGIGYAGVEKGVEKGVENSGKIENVILGIISGNPTISKREMADLSGFSKKCIENCILKLKEKKMIYRVGPDKGGRWRINREETRG